jgi:hypothetical protein
LRTSIPWSYDFPSDINVELVGDSAVSSGIITACSRYKVVKVFLLARKRPSVTGMTARLFIK